MTPLMECEMVPVAEAAVALQLNREQLIRRIQRGQIAGGRTLGRWYVQREALVNLRHRCSRSSRDSREKSA